MSKRSKGYRSKGQRPNVRKDIRKAMRREYVGSLKQLLNKMEAWKQGKRVMLTVPNTAEDNKKKPFVRLPAEEVWGSHKRF